MPQYNGIGPMGAGSLTGRGMGLCTRGNLIARGCFGGQGFGFRRFASIKNELSALANEEKILEEELTAVREEKKALQDQEK